MGAQRKPAVKEVKGQTPARTAQQTSRQMRSAGTQGKTAAAPKNQEQKQSVFTRWTTRISTLVRETRSEIKKVTWPDRETTRKLTLLVIGVSTALGILLGGIDYILLKLFEAL